MSMAASAEATLNFNIGVLGHIDSGKTALGETRPILVCSVLIELVVVMLHNDYNTSL